MANNTAPVPASNPAGGSVEETTRARQPLVSFIEITNHGPLIESTTYWGGPLDIGGRLFCSCNAGAIRILLPVAFRETIADMRTARHCVLSRGPWPEMHLPDAVEILFDDGTDDPFVLHVSPESFDMLPAEPAAGQEWTVTVWTRKKGRPHKALERVCHWRRVPSIPCMLPWKP